MVTLKAHLLAIERDEAIVRGCKTGTGPKRLAELTGLSRGRVNQILARHRMTHL